MDKTVEERIYETEQALINIIETCGLNPAVLELILRSLYKQVNDIAHQSIIITDEHDETKEA